MRFVVIDFETFFGDDFTLSKMSTEAYIRDPRFKAHGAAIKWSKSVPAKWYDEKELCYVLSQEDWSDVFLICHHANFDAFILSTHYNVVPKMYGCTMSMARALHATHLSVSLDNVRARLGFKPKTTPYSRFRGKTWEQLDTQDRQALAEGCEDEVESIWKIFGILAKDFPAEEYEVVDSLVRMFVNPVLRADIDMLADLWESEAVAKQDRFDALGINEAAVQSADKFQALLEAEGVEIQYKQGKNGPIAQFAKNDDFMRELLEHDNERIRTLAEARVGAKSTLLQTRAETLGTMAQRGPLPVYLRYCGAATLRPTGGDGANWLNFKRGSAIRRSILAPEGYLLGPIDASQIECRVLNYLAGQDDVVENFRQDKDPYVALASACYGEEVYNPEEGDPREKELKAKRGMGKQGELMCLGPDTLVLTNNGLKAITTVEATDRLWDGCEWVRHLGLISQGVKNVVSLKGTSMTPDHLVLCENSWQPASLVKGSILSQALAIGSASLPSQAMNWLQEAGSNLSWSGVRANLMNTLSTRIIYLREKVRDARCAHVKHLGLIEKNGMGTQHYARISSTGTGCYHASPLYTIDVEPMFITARAASECIHLGSRIRDYFSNIYYRSRVGMIRPYLSIGLTITKATLQEIYVSLIAAYKLKIGESCAISKRKMQTYDIACAGPRQRFTIATNAGYVIVHNCGYGAAAAQFRRSAKAGLYGPPVELSEADASRFVDVYRDTHPAVVDYWKQCNRIIARLAGGPPLDWGPFLVKDHRLILPSGQAMNYESLAFHRPDADEDCKDFERQGYWRMRVKRGWKKMWGSKLTQNICEMVSRVIVSQAMTRIKRNYGIRSLNWPYDELLLLIPDDSKAEETLEVCRREMCVTPSWLPGLPLDADASLGVRYSK